VQDITTLGVINVRYCGYVVTVKVERGVNENVDSPSQQNIELFDQPEGGANALNINRFLNPSTLHTFINLQLCILFISACCALSCGPALSHSVFYSIAIFINLVYDMSE